MSTHQGARPDHPEDADMLAGSDLTLNDIAQSLIMLGEQLHGIGTAAHHTATRKELEDFYLNQGGRDAMDDLVREDMERAADRERIARTLTALRNFRRNYYYWERLAVEHALSNAGFSQRRVAALLGIGVNTVNRWANNPVATDPEED